MFTPQKKGQKKRKAKECKKPFLDNPCLPRKEQELGFG
jgi:hypothetical protein